MREIKFRAYDKYTKIMLPIVDIIKFTKCEAINIMRDGAYGVGINIQYQPQIELMQYTGLHDKNGKEIYEGDRVYIISEDEYGEIEWDNDIARFVVIYDDLITDFDNWYGYDLEVVGTIYD